MKANIGHTDAASGILSLIKTTLCLHHQLIPPHPHFTAPNPELHLEQSPFYINKELKKWQSKETRYAGVSSFGVGGTNVHLIVKEHAASLDEQFKKQPQEQLFLFSAKSIPALNAYKNHFITYMNRHMPTSEQWINSAYTLYKGREEFEHRTFAVASDETSLITELNTKQPHTLNEALDYNMVWMFPGQGAQYHHMAMDLFNKNTTFKKHVLIGVELANAYLHVNLLELINNKEQNILHQTQYAQPALFIIEYALAQLLMECGVHPNVLIGHSLGEYTAACIAEVFSFEDGIALVCERGLLMSQAPTGAMIALNCSAEDAVRYEQDASIEVALHNTAEHYVFSGTFDAILKLEQLLNTEQTPYQKLKVSHAFHSVLMESIETPFKSIFENIHLSPPKIPIISNVTGTWLSAKEATSPDYWYRHLRTTVQFSKGIDLLNKDKYSIFLEIGPGHTLTHFVSAKKKLLDCITYTLPNHQQKNTDSYQLLSALGLIWTKGISINLSPLMNQKKQLIALPTYAFQKQKYWVEADGETTEFIKKSHHSEPDDDSCSALIHEEEQLTSVQRKIRSLFKRSLGLDRIALEDNYFDLGGHSLAAIALLNAINTHFGTHLSIQHLYQYPTITQLSSLIELTEPLVTPIIIPLKESIHATKTIFLCHPISGVVTSLNDLAQHFPDTYSIFGIQDPSVSSGTLLQNNIKSIATHYLEALRKQQKKGPYYLIGYSFGGTVVYEMAQQLIAQGEKINLLCLIDSWAKHPETVHLESELTSFTATNASSPLPFIELSKQRLNLLLHHIPSQIQQNMLLFKAQHILPSYMPIDHPKNHWDAFNFNNISCYSMECTHEQIIMGKNALKIVQSIIHHNERDA